MKSLMIFVLLFLLPACAMDQFRDSPPTSTYDSLHYETERKNKKQQSRQEDPSFEKYRDRELAQQPIAVRVGEVFTVRLKANPTTGYQWILVSLPKTRLQKISQSYEPASLRIGGGGEEVWTFKALQVGETVLNFQYLRPWEKEVPPVEEKEVRVKISG